MVIQLGISAVIPIAELAFLSAFTLGSTRLGQMLEMSHTDTGLAAALL